MSYVSNNTLQKGAKLSAVRGFLVLLNYHLTKTKAYSKEGFDKFYSAYWFNNKDYKSWSGVNLDLYVDPSKDNCIIVSTHTPESRSYYDLEYQNRTIKLLKCYFGGSFETDEGLFRYFKTTRVPPLPAESGCGLAFSRFGNNLIKIIPFFNNISPIEIPIYKIIIGSDHKLISYNLLIVYLVTVLEDYWKSTFIALLKYSDKKETIIKFGKLSSRDLVEISCGRTSVEEAFAKNLSFQSIEQVCKNFNSLDSRLDLNAMLRQPRGKRKKSLYHFIDELVETRHRLIHQATIDCSLKRESLKEHIFNVIEVAKCTYTKITQTYGWELQQTWLVGKASLT